MDDKRLDEIREKHDGLVDKLLYFVAGGYTTHDTLRSLCKDAAYELGYTKLELSHKDDEIKSYQKAYDRCHDCPIVCVKEEYIRLTQENEKLTAELDQNTKETEQFKKEYNAAVKTLNHYGYTYDGGNYWKSPVRETPDFELIDKLTAELKQYRQMERNRKLTTWDYPKYTKQAAKEAMQNDAGVE